jgi:hypothetical protein
VPYQTEKEKMERRRLELAAIVEEYKLKKDYESARAYEERLVQLENGVAEDYVWRNRLHLSKQSKRQHAFVWRAILRRILFPIA